MLKVNVGSIVESIKKEGGDATPEEIQKTASVSENLGGREATDLEKMASDLSEEVGFDVSISSEFEKVASDMSGAESVEDIIKIAQESGNEDLANIAKIASAFADVVVSRVEDSLLKG